MVQFTALGSLSVVDNGEVVWMRGPRQRRLLAMLLIHRNSVVSVDALIHTVFAGAGTVSGHQQRRAVDGQ